MQISHRLDRSSLAALTESFNQMAYVGVSVEELIAEAESSGRSYLVMWLNAVKIKELQPNHAALVDLAASSLKHPVATKNLADKVLTAFERDIVEVGTASDLAEDKAAWRQLTRDISANLGRDAPVDQFLQELQLWSKAPPPKPNSVTLMTIHGAKGKEFDVVYVIGLAEDVMPWYQSRQRATIVRNGRRTT